MNCRSLKQIWDAETPWDNWIFRGRTCENQTCLTLPAVTEALAWNQPCLVEQQMTNLEHLKQVFRCKHDGFTPSKWEVDSLFLWWHFWRGSSTPQKGMVPDFSDELYQWCKQTVPFPVQVPHLEELGTFQMEHWFDPPIFSFAPVVATAVSFFCYALEKKRKHHHFPCHISSFLFFYYFFVVVLCKTFLI